VTFAKFDSFRPQTLVAAIALVVAASVAPMAAHAAESVASSATALRRGDVVLGALPSSHPMHISVALKLRNADQLKSFIAAAGKRGTRTFGQTMSHDQLMADHAPTAAQAQRVAAYLHQFGFTNIVIAPNRLLVSADGTADSAQQAFMASFVRVRARDGRDTYANTHDVHIPASLQDTVLSVIGLQDVHRPHLGLQTQAVTGHNPTEFSSIYGANSVATGAGVTVGIITQGKITQTITDLNTFTANNGLPTVVTSTVNTNGTSTDTSGIGEWNLDSQDIVGMAGGQVGKIIFYNIPTLSNANLTADINTAVSANAAKIINVSLGECETDAQGDGSAAAQDQSFQTAVAQGQTFSISTGDSGADECANGGTTPSWPAASQYVIAAAGTTLNASTTTWSSETVWSGSGGSESTFEPKPSWQTLWSGTHRGVADIAFDADPNSGSKVIVNGSIQQIGGTSLSAPLFAGAWSRVIATKGTAVGFAGPLIYALPQSDFHDVVSGNNAGSTATTGYDLASGRGSLILNTAMAHIGGGGGNVAPVANFSFTTSGLTATFNDSSSDSDGTIASHSWTFGDGATSTATSPSHTYAAGGTYSVTETVTDNGGLSNAKTTSVTVTSGGGGGNVLTKGVAVTNLSASTGASLNYTMSVPAGATNLVFTQSGGTGDSDMYVKFGSAPTDTSYDCRPYVNGNAETCTFATAQAGTYYVRLKAYSTFSGVSLKGDYTTGGGGGTQTYTNSTPTAIPDVSTITSTINVSGRTGLASSTSQISVNITHTYRGDLKIDLLAPDGSVYALKASSGSDSADNVIATYTKNLSTETLNGAWKLRVQDVAAGDTGTLNNWSITF
jgi:xanthomonalisin